MSSQIFFKLGGSIWFLTLGLALMAVMAQWFSDWELSSQTWHLLWLWGGCGGLGLMIAGGMFAIWSK